MAGKNRKEVLGELEAEQGVNLCHVGVETKKGTIYLIGRIEDLTEAEAAMRAAARARGIREVVNNLKLKGEEGDQGREKKYPDPL